MDARTILEFFGWLSAAFVILSLTFANQRRFRWWNLAGSFVGVCYNAVLGVWPVVATNAVIAGIDIYWLFRLYGHDGEKSQIDGCRVDADVMRDGPAKYEKPQTPVIENR